MNKVIKASTAALVGAVLTVSAVAQEPPAPPAPPAPPKEDKSQEIVIRKKDGKAEKMTIVVDGENVTINGRPVDEFKGSNVTVFKRKGGESNSFAPRVRGADVYRRLMEADNAKGNKAVLGVVTDKADDGAKITSVTKESAAEKAGLKKDDVILKVGNTKISTPQDLVEAIGSYKPNDKIDVTYQRNGKENKTTATLKERKTRVYTYKMGDEDFDFDFDFDMPPMVQGGPGGDHFQFFSHKPKIGMQIQDVEEGKGVTVEDVDEKSPAEKAGMKEDDVITHVNGTEIAGVDEFREQIKDLKEGDTVKVTYKRGGASQTAEIKIPKKLKTANL